MKELLDSDRLNFLVWRFVKPAAASPSLSSSHLPVPPRMVPVSITSASLNDYRETAAKFQKEWHIQEPHRHFDFAPHIKTHALVSVINKGLIYNSLERQYVQRQAAERGVVAEGTQSGIFGPLVVQPPRKVEEHDGSEEAEGEDDSGVDEVVDRFSRKRQIEPPPQDLAGESHGSPPMAKKQRLSNGFEHQPDQATTTPMEGIDHGGSVESSHAYPSPLEGESAPVAIPQTDGPDQGTQVEKVQELAPETRYLRLRDEDLTSGATPVGFSNGENAAPVLLHCQWNPKDPSRLAAAGTDALARVWTVTRSTPGGLPNGDRPPSSHVNGADQPCRDLIEEGTHANATMTAMAWNWDGTAIAVANDHGLKACINIWTPDGVHLQRLEVSEQPVTKLRWNPSDTALLAVSVENGSAAVTVFNSVTSTSQSYSLHGHDQHKWPVDVAWINETDFLVCGGDLLRALHCTGSSIELAKDFDTGLNDNRYAHVLFDWRSKLAVTAGEKGYIDIWYESGQRESVAVHTGPVTALEWQPLQTDPMEDERLIASGSDDCSIAIWDARKPHVPAKHSLMMEAPIVALAFTPDGAFIAGATVNHVLIWKVGEHVIPRASWSLTPNPASLSPKANREPYEDEHCLCWDALGQKLAYGANSKLAVINFRSVNTRFFSFLFTKLDSYPNDKLARLSPIATRIAASSRITTVTTRRIHGRPTTRALRTFPATPVIQARAPATQTTTKTGPAAQIRMASDDAYAAFLEKANQDPSQGRTHAAATSPGARDLKSLDEGEEVPSVLAGVTRGKFYVSEADEGFVPVSLRWDGSDLPTEVEFAKLVEHWDPSNAEVEIRDTSDWNRSGDYGDVVEAVTKAVKGADVRVYRVAKDATRAEYFVVGLLAGEGRLLGVKAAAVES
ncbi:related to nuclear receptor co-repressor/HDAC3 complex subunit TBLR1 [Cephalotrichum gorgonifer]|uniref:Related to nuclear receptor co-repressor/HDAC3 complex subunit TBLR1 n=1 Tax=Cephalotrichum gorgonifer TaxID=2041049 RepID=A0AAE8SWD0_9PEZI|nr:related to nuclear receptor co-repressor/HDAC3 complex subunit TBLR1 [Cephalotrichum gorgonifer]